MMKVKGLTEACSSRCSNRASVPGQLCPEHSTGAPRQLLAAECRCHGGMGISSSTALRRFVPDPTAGTFA